MSDQPTIATYVPDLMDQSKVRSAFPAAEKIRSAAALGSCTADLVLVDLGRPGVLEVLPDIAGRVVGFASHVDDEVIALAWAAGADVVLVRSVFFRRLSEGVEAFLA